MVVDATLNRGPNLLHCAQVRNQDKDHVSFTNCLPCSILFMISNIFINNNESRHGLLLLTISNTVYIGQL